MKTFYIETFGCQMNAHDSEKVVGTLLSKGYAQSTTPEDADLLLYNTCSIRDKAEQKVFHRLNQFKKAGQGKVFGVIGCVAQQEGEKIFDRAPQVSLVAGSASYTKLPELIAQLERGDRRVTGLSLDTSDTFETPHTRRDHSLKAYITIIEGCSKSCAYCVVPMTRGPERSRTADSVLAEARQLIADGYTEIMLLGQNVNSYRDPSPKGWDFARLLRAMGELDGLHRVRFTTSHPRDFVKDIVDAMAENPVLCNWIHLPVQSGSDRVLQAMDRLYTRRDYLQRIEWIRNASRPFAITTDIITGFPGETEEDFAQTLSLLEQVQYESIYAFKYSPRPNTPALKLHDHITEEEKSRRLNEVQQVQRQIQIKNNAEMVGEVHEVLVEGYNSATDQWIGRSSMHQTINFTRPLVWELDKQDRRSLLGRYVPVTITRAGPASFGGETDHAIHATLK